MKALNLCRPLARPACRKQSIQYRFYAVQAAGNPSLRIFNSSTKHLQRERAAANVDLSRKVDYLKDEVASRLCERLLVSFVKVA